MFRLCREFLRAMTQRLGRMRFIYSCVRNCPGEYGFILRRWALKGHFKKSGANLRIHEGFRFRNLDHVTLGDNVNLGVDCFIQAGGDVELGDYVILGPGVKIWTQNHASERTDIPIQQQGYEYKPVKLGRDVWVGANAFIMPGAELGDGCIVSAGAVVGAKKVPPYKIMAGNPARAIGTRETEPKENSADNDSSKS